MLRQQIQQRVKERFVVVKQDDIATYVGRKQKLIVLEAPIDNVPLEYTQITMTYKDQAHTFLIPEKAKMFMANPGENGDPLDALDELADFYQECGDFEHELMIGGLHNAPQVNVSTLARESYGIWAVNRLVKQKNGSEMPEWNQGELERLGVHDLYIETRLKGIAAAMLNKKSEELRGTGLEDILIHKTLIIRDETVKELAGYVEHREAYQEAHSIQCYCGSHYEWRTEYRINFRTVSEPTYRDVHYRDTVDYTALPNIERMEQEIEDYRKRNGSTQTRHDQALFRTFLNLQYIAKSDPSKQLDVVSTVGRK